MNIQLQLETKVLIVHVQIECNYNQLNSKTFILHSKVLISFHSPVFAIALYDMFSHSVIVQSRNQLNYCYHCLQKQSNFLLIPYSHCLVTQVAPYENIYTTMFVQHKLQPNQIYTVS